MGLVRVIARLAGLVLWSAPMYAGVVIPELTQRLGARLRGHREPPDPGPRRTRLFHRWSRGVIALLGVRTDVTGTAPAPPFLLVSNHLSYLDVVLLASHVRCVFVSKSEVERWPVVGAMCRAADTLFIDRDSKRDVPRVTGKIESVLGSGRGVILFPEGTTTRGDGVGRFRPGLLEAAASSEIPVSYAALSYRTPPGSAPAHLAVCWWGEMPFLRHLLRLLAQPEIRATLSFGETGIRERDRKVLARRLQHAVAEQFQPVV